MNPDLLNKIHQGDCLSFMKSLPDKCVDLTVTSPPYDGLRDYNGYSFDFEKIAHELFRITKEGGVVVWVVGDATVNGSESGTSFRQALFFKDCGFNLHDTMIYQRMARFPETTRYMPEFEYMFVLSKGKPKSINLISDIANKKAGTKIVSKQREKDGTLKPMSSTLKGGVIKENRVRGNVWWIDAGFNLSTKDINAFEHPAIFPEQLAADHIVSWSNDGDIVFDPFMGSGTTAKMAKILSRKFLGCELSEKYVAIANERLKQDYLF